MTHTTKSQQATTRGRLALVRTDAPRPIGNSFAGRGATASRAFALRHSRCVEIRCRAFATGGNR
jgi:hypothetical protein